MKKQNYVNYIYLDEKGNKKLQKIYERKLLLSKYFFFMFRISGNFLDTFLPVGHVIRGKRGEAINAVECAIARREPPNRIAWQLILKSGL